jgi:hypothetical protein
MNLEKVKKGLTGLVSLTAFLVLAANTHVFPVAIPHVVIDWIAGIGLFVSLGAKSLFGWIILPTASSTNEPGSPTVKQVEEATKSYKFEVPK